MKRRPVTAPSTFMPMLFGSIVKQPSTNVPP
jgi:hypothetical protein